MPTAHVKTQLCTCAIKVLFCLLECGNTVGLDPIFHSKVGESPPLRWLWSKVVGGKGGRGVLVVSQIWILLLLPARQGRKEDAISGQRKREKSLSFFFLVSPFDK